MSSYDPRQNAKQAIAESLHIIAQIQRTWDDDPEAAAALANALKYQAGLAHDALNDLATYRYR